MKYLQKYEARIERNFKIGDKVIYDDPFINSCIGVVPFTREAIYGDLCEITNVKIVKGEEYVKVKNLKTNKMICKQISGGTRVMSYSREGNWINFYYFEKEDTFQYNFIFAVKANNKDLIKRLLEKNPDINIIDKCGKTPLHYAAKNNNIELIIKLIELKSDVTMPENKDVINVLNTETRDILKNQYPDIYEHILDGIEAGKYNI